MTLRAGMPAVLVIGDVMLDVVAAPQAAIEAGSDTPATIRLLPGGSGANTAAWLGALGVPVIFAGRAGSDSCAYHASDLRAHGVEAQLACDPERRTGVLVSLVAPGGERSFLTDRGANANLGRSDLGDALLDRVSLIHVSAYALTDLESRAAVLDFLDAAAARTIPFTIDPGSVAVLRHIGPAAFLALTHAAIICFPNVAEAALLSGTAEADPTAALERLAANYETVVVKTGAAGAIARSNDGNRLWSADAHTAAVVRDTTGAGDAFVAGYLAARLAGGDVAACLANGVATGVRAVGHLGGRPTVP